MVIREVENKRDFLPLLLLADEQENMIDLSVAQPYQGNGYGKMLIEFVTEYYRTQYAVLQVGTGDSPLTVPFYEHCGFVKHHILKNYIIDHYDQPIFEEGKQLIDKVFLRMNL